MFWKKVIDDAVPLFPSTFHMSHLPANNSKLEDESTESQTAAAISLHEDIVTRFLKTVDALA